MSVLRSTRLWVAAGVLTAGCGGPAALRYERELEQTPPTAAHAVHEARLQQLMREMDRLRDERLPKALDPEVERRRQLVEVERVARAMADSAGRIAAAAPAGLGPAQRREFLALAAALELGSRALADEVGHLTRPQRRRRVEEIDATCARCHARFRIPGVPVGGA